MTVQVTVRVAGISDTAEFWSLSLIQKNSFDHDLSLSKQGFQQCLWQSYWIRDTRPHLLDVVLSTLKMKGRTHV